MSKTIQPEVGMGATLRVGSDCYPYTVVEVRSLKTIGVTADKFTRTDKRGPHTEAQEYSYISEMRDRPMIFTLRKNGRWHQRGSSMKGCPLCIGHRRAHRDPSF